MIITSEMKAAIDLIENTEEAVYITGKAGTGKTTLLRYIIKAIVRKRFVIAAPTGVAAVNAGGVTLHSLFNIPFGCLNDKTKLGTMPKSKAELVKSLDVLIIDEISMVRPDVLDFIDRKLRTYRLCDKPFGGVQLVMFGDLYQLPPVVKSDEQEILSKYYNGTYFFHAHIFKTLPFNIISLTQIFRQSDPKFIELLNNIRSYTLSVDDLDDLAELRNKSAVDDFDSGSIHLCALKRDAQAINNRLLGEPTNTYPAIVKGKFNLNSAPCDELLELRIGARIMMLVNNHQAGYYNGSLGYVTDFKDGKIYVSLDKGGEFPVEPYTWEAKEFVLEDGKVTTKTIGSCTQHPLTLAWAVTIHKSQGLTFDRIVVHTQKTFVPGQIYVALSRCTSLSGISLDSFITKKHILPDNELIEFEKALTQTNGVFTEETYRLISK